MENEVKREKQEETGHNPEVESQPAPPQIPPPPPPPASSGGSGMRGVMAALLSVFPGVGHLFLGSYLKAVAVFLGFVGTAKLSGALDMGWLPPFFVWCFGIFDAYKEGQEGGSSERPANYLPWGIILVLAGAVLLLKRFFPHELLVAIASWWPAVLVMLGIYLIVSGVSKQKKQADTGGGE